MKPAEEHQLEWALREVAGAESPPDLAAATVARLRLGHARSLPAVPTTASAPPRRWLAAAILLLGVAAVAAVAVLARTPQDEIAAPQDPPSPPASVYSRADIEALPKDTRAVLGTGLDDDDVAALLRLKELRELELRYPEAMVLGLGLKTPAPTKPRCITVSSLATIAQLSKLRVLRLRGAHGITEAFPPTAVDLARVGEDTIGQLARLPLLEELALSHFDVPGPALASIARLQSLRVLDLAANYGVDAASMPAILALRGLRRLSLHACMTLPGTAIATLRELPLLEELDVGEIGSIEWRSAPDTIFGPVARYWRDAADKPGHRLDVGLTDDAIRGLVAAPRLCVLRAQAPNCSRAGFRTFADFEALQALDLGGIGGVPGAMPLVAADLPRSLRRLAVCGEFDDGFCIDLGARLQQLEELEFPACYGMHDRGLAALLQLPKLRVLDIRQSRGLTPAAFELLRAATRLEWLDVRHIDWVTDDQVRTLRDALPKLATVYANTANADDANAPPRSRPHTPR